MKLWYTVNVKILFKQFLRPSIAADTSHPHRLATTHVCCDQKMTLRLTMLWPFVWIATLLQQAFHFARSWIYPATLNPKPKRAVGPEPLELNPGPLAPPFLESRSELWEHKPRIPNPCPGTPAPKPKQT